MILSPEEISASEAERIKELYALELLDTPYEKEYDDIAQLAVAITGIPYCAISLIDMQRQWYKARAGFEAVETPRSVALCNDTIQRQDMLEIEDLHTNEEFRDHPSRTYSPGTRYYAGLPLRTHNGHAVGTLCLFDNEPRKLNPQQAKAMEVLASQVMKLLDLRLSNKELKTLTETQQRILAITGHDIKSPLTALKMVLNMREEGDISIEEEDEMLMMLRQQVSSAIDLINNLVAWAKVQHTSAHPVEVNVHSVAVQCIRELQAVAAEKGNRLVNDLPDDLRLVTDHFALTFLLRNLLGNANKFTKGGSILLSMREDENGKWLVINDTGIGMTPKILDMVRKQASGTNRDGTSGESGSGLGLILIADYLRASRGKMNIDSKEGTGTEISILL